MKTQQKQKQKKQKPATISGYSTTMDEAAKQLELARTYAEDGAQMDAVRCAADAISLLLKAKHQRDTFLEEQKA